MLLSLSMSLFSFFSAALLASSFPSSDAIPNRRHPYIRGMSHVVDLPKRDPIRYTKIIDDTFIIRSLQGATENEANLLDVVLDAPEEWKEGTSVKLREVREAKRTSEPFRFTLSHTSQT